MNKVKRYLRLRVGLKALYKVVDGVVDQEEVTLLAHIQSGGSCAFLEASPCILHEFVVIEADADSALHHLKVELLEQKIVADPLRYLWLVRCTGGCR